MPLDVTARQVSTPGHIISGQTAKSGAALWSHVSIFVIHSGSKDRASFRPTALLPWGPTTATLARDPFAALPFWADLWISRPHCCCSPQAKMTVFGTNVGRQIPSSRTGDFYIFPKHWRITHEEVGGSCGDKVLLSYVLNWEAVMIVLPVCFSWSRFETFPFFAASVGPEEAEARSRELLNFLQTSCYCVISPNVFISLFLSPFLVRIANQLNTDFSVRPTTVFIFTESPAREMMCHRTAWIAVLLVQKLSMSLAWRKALSGWGHKSVCWSDASMAIKGNDFLISS